MAGLEPQISFRAPSVAGGEVAAVDPQVLVSLRNIETGIQAIPESLSAALKVPQPTEGLISARHKWIMAGLGALSGAGVLTIAGLSKAFDDMKGSRDAANRALDDAKKSKPKPIVGEWPLDKKETFMVLGGLALILLGVAYFSASSSTPSSPLLPPPAPYGPPRF